ncbi:hypothetical protein OF83DRAFT_196479 [Amylostereum chailletii]|nr:hypothetical protein OF83DRAFT_196479 [Amylostereum chailletii]
MELLRQFLQLACRCDFSFNSIWLASALNPLADTASRFQYARLFQLAPALDKQPSFRRLKIGSTNSTMTSPAPQHFTFGMASRAPREKHTQPAKNHFSTSANSAESITSTDPSCQPPRHRSWNGQQASQVKFNPKQSRLTSPTSNPSTSSVTFHSQRTTPYGSNASYEESSASTARRTAAPSSQSPLMSSKRSSQTLTPAPCTTPSTQHAALPTPASSDAASSPSMASSTPQRTSPRTHSSFAPTRTATSSLSSISRRPKPTLSGKACPSTWPQRLASFQIPSPHSSGSCAPPPPIPPPTTHPFSKNPRASHSHGTASSRKFAPPSPAQASTLRATLDTASAAAPPLPPTPPGARTTKSRS